MSSFSRPTLDSEWELISRGIKPVAGVDEAGRGPLAGPVIAAAVILPENFSFLEYPGLEKLNDSKKLSEKVREKIFSYITTNDHICWAIGEASAEEIGELNILRATGVAMQRALDALKPSPAHALIDGLPVRDLLVPQTALIKGDSRSLSIAAASIIAKVSRDRMMNELDQEFPQYEFARHKGYGTAVHLEALRKYGPCRHHRRGFAPVERASLGY